MKSNAGGKLSRFYADTCGANHAGQLHKIVAAVCLSLLAACGTGAQTSGIGVNASSSGSGGSSSSSSSSSGGSSSSSSGSGSSGNGGSGSSSSSSGSTSSSSGVASVAILHSFTGGVGGSTDTSFPTTGVIQGADGNFYGTTYEGGSGTPMPGFPGGGTAFKVTPAGVESVLYSFTDNRADGTDPHAGLTLGTDGNLYGTTLFGGNPAGSDFAEGGTAFKITPAGVETVLYTFGTQPGDGGGIVSGLIQGSDGNFYGTAEESQVGPGNVYKITPAGVETVLYSFRGSPDGESPTAALVQGSDGNFYGTTPAGGSYSRGTVFKITSSGAETILYSFGASHSDALGPGVGLVQGRDGNFYGTTTGGGSASSSCPQGCGAVFKITPLGVETVLYSFGSSPNDGQEPGGLILGSDGNFYGVTGGGGANGDGTAFTITPFGVETVLYSFGSVPDDGLFPSASLFQGSDGTFYGTTARGGAAEEGTVFKLTMGGS